MHVVVASQSSPVCVWVKLSQEVFENIRLIATSDKMEEKNVSSRT